MIRSSCGSIQSSLEQLRVDPVLVAAADLVLVEIGAGSEGQSHRAAGLPVECLLPYIPS